MKYRIRVLSIAALAALLLTIGSSVLQSNRASAAVQELSGVYKISKGVNPDGSKYQGTVKMSREGEIYNLDWTIGNGQTQKGVAIQVGDALAVGWTVKGAFGVVAYKIDGGRLSGKWSGAGLGGRTGTEILEGPKNLSGVYNIAGSSQPGGGPGYKGTVAITPNGDTFLLKWTLANESYSGVGIRYNDLLVVGWSLSDQTSGAVVYKIRSGNALEGAWAIRGLKTLGEESLAR